MVKRKISGIKRSVTAIEGTYRHFLTTTRILSHFKRDADKKIIKDLIKEKPSLNNLLLSTAAIHLYHNMGIRVLETFQGKDQFTFESTSAIEEEQKLILMEEFEMILKNSFNLEIDLLYNIIDLENLVITYLIKEEASNITESEKAKFQKELEKEIEIKLLGIINQYPPFYFYDFIGDLIGFTDIVKQEILESSSSFKDVSIDLEKKMEREEKEDNFIELSTLNRIIKLTRKSFEFKSYKELKIQALPVRMIKKRIIDHETEKFPISVKALRTFIKGHAIKKNMIELIDQSLKRDIDYDQFEKKILGFIKLQLIEQLTHSPNDFVYLLQSLNESGFEDIIYLINQIGIYDILNIIEIDKDITEKIQSNMIRYNIQRQDILILQKEDNILNKAKKLICELNFPFLRKIIDSEELDLTSLVNNNDPKYKPLWDLIEERLGIKINDIREFIRKEQIIKKIFFFEQKLNNYDQILTLLDFEEILNKLVRDIFLFILTKILRQYSRIIELYDKITNEKGLYLLALKKIDGILESEEWVRIKFEELIIKRIMARQEELTIVFNATNQVFLVNGFILALLLNNSLKEGISKLRTEPSRIYSKFKPIVLKADLLSPISYCIAYDILKRFEEYNTANKAKAIEVIESGEKENQLKREEIRSKQEENAFNWIERKITSSIMGIVRPGINPNFFYWDKIKDTRVLAESIKIFVESDDDVLNRFYEFYKSVVDLMRRLEPLFKFPDDNKLRTDIQKYVDDLMSKRLQHQPSKGEINNMLDGERLSVANQISKDIGKLLDKLLYFRFKKKRKNG